MSLVNFETRYEDVLQNIEFAIVGVYRAHPELLDYDVEAALEALIARYTAEQRGRQAREASLPGLRREVFDAVLQACEFRLGRGTLVGARIEPKTVDEIVMCLQCIRKSVRMWNREGGRQGYLGFVRQYVF